MSNDKNLPVVKESNTDYHAETLPIQAPQQSTLTSAPDEQIDVLDVVESCSAYLSLSPQARLILKQYVMDFITEEIHSDNEIAALVGCHVNTVYNAKKNVLLQRAITEIMPAIGKINNLHVLQQIRKWIEKDWRAGEYYHKVTGAYVPRSQQAILTGRMENMAGMGRIKSPQGAIKAVVSQFGGLGYTLDRLVEEITAAWTQAKEEGQF